MILHHPISEWRLKLKDDETTIRNETQTPGQDCIQTDTEKLIAIFPLQIS